MLLIRFLGVACLAAAAAGDATKPPTSQRKLEQARSAAASSPVGILRLEDGNFTRFALSKPRPYHLAVLFTALDPRIQCQACVTMQPVFETVALSYAMRHPSAVAKGESPLFFGVLDFANGRSVFEKMAFQTAPHVYLLPPDADLSKGKPEQFDKHVITHVMQGGAEAIVEEIRVRTGITIPVRKDTSGLKWAAAALAVAAAVAAHFIAEEPSRAVKAARGWRLWLLASVCFYAFGVGGFVYCIIRHPRPYGISRDPSGAAGSSIQLFNQAGREQYQLEGGVIAALYLAMAAALLLAAWATTWRRLPAVLRSMVALAAATLFVYCFSLFFGLYQLKTPWYALGGDNGVLPQAVMVAFTGTVKKSHGLVKRMARLSAIWLNEFTTAADFRRKTKTLLLDWLLRRLREFSPFGGK